MEFFVISFYGWDTLPLLWCMAFYLSTRTLEKENRNVNWENSCCQAEGRTSTEGLSPRLKLSLCYCQKYSFTFWVCPCILTGNDICLNSTNYCCALSFGPNFGLFSLDTRLQCMSLYYTIPYFFWIHIARFLLDWESFHRTKYTLIQI